MPDSSEPTATWAEYRVMILRTLERVDNSISRLESRIDTLRSEEIAQMHVRISLLEVKVIFIAAIASLITGGTTSAIVSYLLR